MPKIIRNLKLRWRGDVKVTAMVFFTVIILLPMTAFAGDGYKITGRSGGMFFVAVDTNQKENEDVYRLAVGESCSGKAVCQVQFWVGSAPSKFPLTDDQIASKLVQWKQNLNTGLRTWLVKCGSSSLFSGERECM